MNRKDRQILDELNAVKARLREDEIAGHGKPISCPVVERNRKKYTRKIKHKKKNYEV